MTDHLATLAQLAGTGTSTDKIARLRPMIAAAVPELLTGPLELAAPVWAFLEPVADAEVDKWLNSTSPDQIDAGLATLAAAILTLRSDDAPPFPTPPADPLEFSELTPAQAQELREWIDAPEPPA